MTGQADDRILRGRLDHRIHPTLHHQSSACPPASVSTCSTPSSALNASAGTASANVISDFVALDVLELGHAAHPHQLPLTDDRPRGCRSVPPRSRYARRERPCALQSRTSLTIGVELLLVERVQAIGRLIENQHARAVHKGLNQHHLALVATGILAKLAAGIQVQVA